MSTRRGRGDLLRRLWSAVQAGSSLRPASALLLAPVLAPACSAATSRVPARVPGREGGSRSQAGGEPAVPRARGLGPLHAVLAEGRSVSTACLGAEARPTVLPPPRGGDSSQGQVATGAPEGCRRVAFSLKGVLDGRRRLMAAGSARDGRLARRGGQGAGGDRPERRAGTRAGWDGPRCGAEARSSSLTERSRR
jgi:hypothetical protein